MDHFVEWFKSGKMDAFLKIKGDRLDEDINHEPTQLCDHPDADPFVEWFKSGKMDAFFQIKRRKLDADISRQPTRLCDLPDAVLHNILSLLPTKDAVRMSMSSKRWESLWRSVPRLELHEKDRPTQGETRLFMDFVDRCLRLREGSSINVFSLSCSVKSDSSRISAWIADVVLQHNVQDLRLSLDDSQPLPSCIFRCEQLRILHLKGLGSLGILHQVYLPNLKDLSLQYCGLIYAEDESIQKLLSSRSLERLSIIGCVCSIFLKALTISSPMLHTVLIHDCDVRRTEVAIDAPSLKHFRLQNKLPNKIVILGSPLLDEAEILSWRSFLEKGFGKTFLQLLQGISRVKNLTLYFKLLRGLKDLECTFNTIPVFPNLRKLKFVLFSNDDFDWKPMCLLLRRCPYIETLEFDGTALRMEPAERSQDPLPPFVLSNLTKITIGDFRGSSNELSGLEVLLRSAPVLEVMVLKYKSCSPEELTKLNERCLRTLPEVSRSCRILIVSRQLQIVTEPDPFSYLSE